MYIQCITSYNTVWSRVWVCSDCRGYYQNHCFGITDTLQDSWTNRYICRPEFHAEAPSSSPQCQPDLKTVSLMAINGFRLHSPPPSLHLPHLSIILSPTRLSLSAFLPNLSFYLPDYLPILLVASLPPLSHFPPLIHLSDFTGTLGDPGQTRCRGNRQSRNILFFFSGERERDRDWKASERQLMYLTERTRFGFRVMFSQRCGLHTCF